MLSQHAQRARRSGNGHLRRRADGRGPRGRARPRRRPRRHRGRHQRRPGAGVGRRRVRRDRDAGIRPVQPRRARAARDVRVRLRRGPGIPGPARPPHHRQPRAHRAAAARLFPAARSSTPRGGCSASTRTASARAFTWPYPPMRRCGPRPTRLPAASQRRRRSLASPSPPAMWPGVCAAPSACPRPKGSSSSR